MAVKFIPIDDTVKTVIKLATEVKALSVGTVIISLPTCRAGLGSGTGGIRG